MAGTLTAANSVITLSCAGIYDAPVNMQGFGADDVFEVGSLKQVETVMGVDGTFSAGFIFNEVDWGLTLEPNSLSIIFFDTIMAQQQAAIEVYPITGTILLPSIRTSYILDTGYLVDSPPMPSAKKILQPRKFNLKCKFIKPVGSA
jgi:hypothetical protein